MFKTSTHGARFFLFATIAPLIKVVHALTKCSPGNLVSEAWIFFSALTRLERSLSFQSIWTNFQANFQAVALDDGLEIKKIISRLSKNLVRTDEELPENGSWKSKNVNFPQNPFQAHILLVESKKIIFRLSLSRGDFDKAKEITVVGTAVAT